MLLRDRLLSGYYPRGKRLPEERKLAEELAISRKTLRAALAHLESENLLCRYPRLGTFVHLGESERENFCYYILPCHDYSRCLNYPSMVGHLRLISGAVQACVACHAQCVMLPMSNDNNPEHLLAERLYNLPQEARLILTGGSWYKSLFPLFTRRKFRIAMYHTRPKEYKGNLPNIHFIGFAGAAFFQAGLRFLNQRGCRRPLFVTMTEEPYLLEANVPTIRIVSGDFQEISRIRKAFFDFQCDSIFCEVFPPVATLWSLNSILEIPENIPVLANDNLMDFSSMVSPPHLIGFDFQDMARRGIDFLFSDAPGGNEFCSRIIFNKNKMEGEC